MKKILFWLLLILVMLLPHNVAAKVGATFAYGTAGTETTGDLGNVDCSNRDGLGTNLEDGDMYVVIVEGTDGAPGTVSFWKFIADVDDSNSTALNIPWDCSTGAGTGNCEDGEDTADMIFPKNQANCTTANEGAFIKVSAVEFARSSSPVYILRDINAPDSDDNFRIIIDCTAGDCTSASEDVDVYIQSQIDGTEYTTFIHLDCDASGNCDVDLIPAGTGVIQRNGANIDAVPIKITSSSPYTIGTTNAAECWGGLIYAAVTGDVVACDNLAAGMSFSVIVIGDIQVDLDVQADDLMNLDGVPLNDGDKAVNPAAAQPGSAIVCTYYDATGWYCMSGSTDGTQWADGS